MAKNVEKEIKQKIDDINHEDIPLTLTLSLKSVRKINDFAENYYIQAPATNFLTNDIAGVCKIIGGEFNNINIVNITNYFGTQEEKKKNITEIVDLFKNTDNIICTESYVNGYEFPADEYYYPNTINPDDIDPNMKEIPVKEVIDRESDMLKSIGFISVSNFVQYRYSEPFIYPNKNGKAVIDKMNKLLEKSED